MIPFLCYKVLKTEAISGMEIVKIFMRIFETSILVIAGPLIGRNKVKVDFVLRQTPHFSNPLNS